MYSYKDNKAIERALEELRPARIIASMPLALRAGAQQNPLSDSEIRRVHGTGHTLEIPSRVQSMNSQSI